MTKRMDWSRARSLKIIQSRADEDRQQRDREMMTSLRRKPRPQPATDQPTVQVTLAELRYRAEQHTVEPEHTIILALLDELTRIRVEALRHSLHISIPDPEKPTETTK